MLFAILDFSVAPEQREHALAQLLSVAPKVRRMPGNVDMRAFASRESPSGITVLHEWQDRQSFEVYLSSEEFAESSRVLRPLMTSTPSSRRFDATLVENVR